MELSLDPHCLDRYRSPSQQGGCLGEEWADKNLYCPNCPQPKLTRQKAGMKVIDFTCPQCTQTYNIKASKHAFKHRITDSEYQTFMTAVNERRTPNFVLMHYDKPRLVVVDLDIVPRFFITSSCVIPNKPTKPKSRGQFWQGCYISLDKVPSDGRVGIVRKEHIETPHSVREKFARTAKLLLRKTIQGRGWTADVLRCVRDLRKSSFALQDVYSYEQELQSLHRENKNIRPKIRQQLQVLRDNNILRFVAPGQYELV